MGSSTPCSLTVCGISPIIAYKPAIARGHHSFCNSHSIFSSSSFLSASAAFFLLLLYHLLFQLFLPHQLLLARSSPRYLHFFLHAIHFKSHKVSPSTESSDCPSCIPEIFSLLCWLTLELLAHFLSELLLVLFC